MRNRRTPTAGRKTAVECFTNPLRENLELGWVAPLVSRGARLADSPTQNFSLPDSRARANAIEQDGLERTFFGAKRRRTDFYSFGTDGGLDQSKELCPADVNYFGANFRLAIFGPRLHELAPFFQCIAPQ